VSAISTLTAPPQPSFLHWLKWLLYKDTASVPGRHVSLDAPPGEGHFGSGVAAPVGSGGSVTPMLALQRLKGQTRMFDAGPGETARIAITCPPKSIAPAGTPTPERNKFCIVSMSARSSTIRVFLK
jgi:hypothetical protein